jgi:DNA-binding CsgD family transcriptional regulator
MTMEGGSGPRQPLVLMSSQLSETSAPEQPAARRVPSAEKVWRDILSGRWIVLRHRDENGRRYLYVQESTREGSAAGNLTERERLVVSYRAYGQGLKRIAYELGVSVPTVTRCLSKALQKLGLNSDMELPAVFGAGLRNRRRG